VFCGSSVFKVIFFSSIPYHQHPMGEDSRRQKNYHFRSFSQQSTFSLRYFAPLRLCVEMRPLFNFDLTPLRSILQILVYGV
jgi:hypothetical protein